MSTYPGDEILMDVDYRTHPAWTGKGRNVFDTSNKDINEFNNRFPGFIHY
ncbi:ribosomal L31 family protein [Orientia tsutsugamushi str. Gilliam]|uniref:Large ribosomal subunit protein bL31 n=1 Tax=Orientia tsutsugamushi str. Gilliam TaxID=1359184 RepID=A0A0F3M6N2_ORITS|nr:ribosomal L31 family protein [Orientia tsutsugamushi str. Gilliam]